MTTAAPLPLSLGTPVDPASLQCFNLRGNAGRNIIVGPGIKSLDFSVFKNNRIKRISENFNVQFRVEMFNIMNHPNFAPPTVPDNSDIFDGNGITYRAVAGLLTRTTVSRTADSVCSQVHFLIVKEAARGAFLTTLAVNAPG